MSHAANEADNAIDTSSASSLPQSASSAASASSSSSSFPSSAAAPIGVASLTEPLYASLADYPLFAHTVATHAHGTHALVRRVLHIRRAALVAHWHCLDRRRRALTERWQRVQQKQLEARAAKEQQQQSKQQQKQQRYLTAGGQRGGGGGKTPRQTPPSSSSASASWSPTASSSSSSFFSSSSSLLEPPATHSSGAFIHFAPVAGPRGGAPFQLEAGAGGVALANPSGMPRILCVLCFFIS
jgi:hypothetical protein